MNGALWGQALVDAISLGSLYAVFALGVALVFSVLKMINFAHSELVTIGAFVLILGEGVPLPLRVAIMTIVVVTAAVLMERVAFRPVRGANQITLLITSFAVSYLLQNLAILIFGPDLRSGSVWPFLGQSFSIGPIRILNLSLVTVIITLLVLGGLSLFLRRTPIGLQMRAAAEDFTMSRLAGVRANRVILVAFALSLNPQIGLLVDLRRG